MNIEILRSTSTDNLGNITVTEYQLPFVLYGYIVSLFLVAGLVMVLYKIYRS